MKKSALMTNVKIDQVEKLELHLKYLFEAGVNFKSRIITISEEIDDALFLKVDAAMSEMESHNGKAITVRINSEGGDPYSAAAIVGRMHASDCVVNTEGFGKMMSAATLILAAGKKRKVSYMAWFMWHESSYGVEGRHDAIKSVVAQQEREENSWAEWMAKFTKRDKKFWLENSKKDTYMSPAELISAGVVDEII